LSAFNQEMCIEGINVPKPVSSFQIPSDWHTGIQDTRQEFENVEGPA